MDDKMHPQIIQQNRKKASDKSKGDKQRTEKAKSTRGSVTSAPTDRKILVPPTDTSGTEQKKGAKKRTYSDISSHQGALKPKWKATEAAVILNQPTPTE
jgi:RNA exonuclease 4